MHSQKMFSLAATFALAAFAFGCAGSAFAQSGHEDKNAESRIAFIQANPHTPGGDVYTMTPTGGDERQLTNLGPNNRAFWQNWSADGRQIVFSEFPNNGNGQLWLMNADGSHQHLLLGEAAYDEEAPGFSPDGDLVVFTRCHVVSNQTECAIYRIRTNGTGLRALTPFRLDVIDFEPAVSPDGTTIAFESVDRGGLIRAIYLMKPDGSDIRRLTPPALTAVNPQWSRDGEKIVFRSHCCNPQNNDIWVIRRDGSGLARLTGSTHTDYYDVPPAYQNVFPSFSPDGRAVVFSQLRFSDFSETIYVLDVEKGGTLQLLARPAPPRRSETAVLRNSRSRLRDIENNGAWPRWSPELH
jgi:Tol biopolymer transport system component